MNQHKPDHWTDEQWSAYLAEKARLDTMEKDMVAQPTTMKRKVWVCTAGDAGEVYFTGTGPTEEAAIKDMYEKARQLYQDRAEPGDPPVTIDDAKENVDSQYYVTAPFEIEV